MQVFEKWWKKCGYSSWFSKENDIERLSIRDSRRIAVCQGQQELYYDHHSCAIHFHSIAKEDLLRFRGRCKRPVHRCILSEFGTRRKIWGAEPYLQRAAACWCFYWIAKQASCKLPRLPNYGISFQGLGLDQIILVGTIVRVGREY